MKKTLLLAFAIQLTLLIPSLSQAQTENALSFDNVDDYVLVPNASALIANSNQISLSCWVKPMSATITFPDYDGFAGIRNNTTADFYMVQFGNKRVEARFRNSSGVNFDVVDTAMLVGVWQYYTLTYNGTELTLYRDGVQIGTTIANGTITTTTESLYIGGMLYGSFNYYMNGSLDEVSLWNKFLSPQEINCYKRFGVPSNTIGLQLYYKFNQGTPGGINVSQAALNDETGHINGNFMNFALSGLTSNFVSGVTTVNDIADSYCHGGSYQFGTMSLTSPGVYSMYYPTTSGCDSMVRLTLTETMLNTGVTAIDETLTADDATLTYQWVDCQNGYQPIANETAQSFTPSVNGDYAVIVSNGTCQDTSVCSTITVGINPVNLLAGCSVYPNPVQDQLMVHLSNPIDAKVIVTDSMGRVMAQENIHSTENRLQTSSWPAGIYTVEVTSADRKAVFRVSR